MAVDEDIYLVVSRYKTERMTKSLPSLKRGEIPVKIHLTVEDSAFREPVIERSVHITDWRDGIDVGDIDLKEATITEEEAQYIRDRRLAAMREILAEHGYQVIEPVAEA